MACYSPLTAWQHASGAISFKWGPAKYYKSLMLPCGKCIGCLQERSRQWAVRCMHESACHDMNSVVTLTYDDEHLSSRSLNYVHYQNFMKELRKHLSTVEIRFFMSGEYGEKFLRPHFHACLFGIDFLDKTPWKKSTLGSSLFHSPFLSKRWRFGQALVGELTFQSASYIAGYVSKKSGERVLPEGLVPEFIQMSRRPGIGSRWFDAYRSEVYPADHVIHDGREVKPPKFYDRLFAKIDPDAWEQVRDMRIEKALDHAIDNTDERLAARERVERARLSLLKRSLK